MLTSEFNQEMGSLIRSLQTKVAQEPTLRDPEFTGTIHASLALDHIERAIVTLCGLWIQLKSEAS